MTDVTDDAPRIRALITDDDPLVRRLIRDTLQADNMTVIAEANITAGTRSQSPSSRPVPPAIMTAQITTRCPSKPPLNKLNRQSASSMNSSSQGPNKKKTKR